MAKELDATGPNKSMVMSDSQSRREVVCVPQASVASHPTIMPDFQAL